MNKKKNQKPLGDAIKKYRDKVAFLIKHKGAIIDQYARYVYIDDIEFRYGVSDCPLCSLFLVGRDFDTECDGCCIHFDTKKKYCNGTPYSEYETMLEETEDMVSNELINQAKKELSYLESLYKRLYGSRKK